MGSRFGQMVVEKRCSWIPSRPRYLPRHPPAGEFTERGIAFSGLSRGSSTTQLAAQPTRYRAEQGLYGDVAIVGQRANRRRIYFPPAKRLHELFDFVSATYPSKINSGYTSPSNPSVSHKMHQHPASHSAYSPTPSSAHLVLLGEAEFQDGPKGILFVLWDCRGAIDLYATE
jgi:hypothetical protein